MPASRHAGAHRHYKVHTACTHCMKLHTINTPGGIDEVDAWDCLTCRPLLIMVGVGKERHPVPSWCRHKCRLRGSGLGAGACVWNAKALQDLRVRAGYLERGDVGLMLGDVVGLPAHESHAHARCGTLLYTQAQTQLKSTHIIQTNKQTPCVSPSAQAVRSPARGCWRSTQSPAAAAAAHLHSGGSA